MLKNECSYYQDFMEGWKKLETYLLTLGLNIECVILFGSLAYGYPKTLDYEQELKDLNELSEDNGYKQRPEYQQLVDLFSSFTGSILASDADILIFCSNLREKIEELTNLYDHENLYNDNNDLWSVIYRQTIKRGIDMLPDGTLSSQFSTYIPSAEIYLDQPSNALSLVEELIDLCSEEKDEAFARFGFRNDPKRGGVFGTERLYRIKKATIMLQSVLLGKIIQGELPSEVLDTCAKGEKALNAFHHRCAPQREIIHSNIIYHY